VAAGPRTGAITLPVRVGVRPLPEGARMSIALSVVRWVSIPAIHTLWNVQVTGRENIPRSGPVILAANHLSVSDHLFLPAVCPRKVYFMAKAEYFDSPGVRGFVTAQFMTAVGQIPIQRDGGHAAVAGMRQAQDLVGRGEVLGIFPEGTRSPDGRLYRGKTGVARIAVETGATIIPVGLVGTDIVQPLGSRLPRPRHAVQVNIGAPIDLSRFEAMATRRERIRGITDEVMLQIGQLSGQAVVDAYPPRRSAEA
jgi:1-acyl-sn-glycerol-3-phosphate acyltransferase